jgi:hypothetical protein
MLQLEKELPVTIQAVNEVQLNHKYMKRIIIALLIFGCFRNLFAYQDPVRDYQGNRTNWSVSLSYSPYFAFPSDYAGGLVDPYKNYLKGFSFSVEWKQQKSRFGIASGVTYRSKNFNNRTMTFWEVPVQLKLYLTKSAQIFQPYLAADIKFCQFITRPDHPTDFAQPFLDYLGILDLGIGSNIKIHRNIYGIAEGNFGYNMKKLLPNRTFVDLKLGLKVKF